MSRISVIDVGCSGGIDPLFANLRADFFGFEASPEQFRELPAAKNTRYFQLLISDTAGEKDFYACSHVGSVTARPDRETLYGERYEKLRLPCQTLADLRSQGTLPGLDVIKADVEGHEMAVFRGAEPYLSKETLAVKAEFGFKTNFSDLYAFFAQRGFFLAGLAYNIGVLGELEAGDALWLRSVESALQLSRIREAAEIAFALRYYDYGRIALRRGIEEGMLTKDEAAALDRANGRTLLLDLYPPLSHALSQAAFLASQLVAGRSWRTKSAPKQNRLGQSRWLTVPLRFAFGYRKWFDERLRCYRVDYGAGKGGTPE
jgi:FkbM family methyltransferase